ncbi:MAG: hypothetical protein RLZZ204_885, partial [Bacteroidota bacterium]
MIRFIIALLILCISMSFSNNINIGKGKKWISLFDGKSFNGWKMGENPGTFTIEDGSIKVAGPRSHLYYDGAVMNH